MGDLPQTRHISFRAWATEDRHADRLPDESPPSSVAHAKKPLFARCWRSIRRRLRRYLGSCTPCGSRESIHAKDEARWSSCRSMSSSAVEQCSQMCRQDHEEKLKDVILYCKKTMGNVPTFQWSSSSGCVISRTQKGKEKPIDLKTNRLCLDLYQFNDGDPLMAHDVAVHLPHSNRFGLVLQNSQARFFFFNLLIDCLPCPTTQQGKSLLALAFVVACSLRLSSSRDAVHKHSCGFAPLPCTCRRISTSDVVGPGATVPHSGICTLSSCRLFRFKSSSRCPLSSVRAELLAKGPIFFFGPKMTSFGSQTFLLEAWNGGGNGPVVHQSKPSCRIRPPVVAACCRENGIGLDGGWCRVRFRMRGRRSEILVGVEKGTGLRATGKGGNFEGEGGIGDDIVAGGYVDVDSAQATVTKGKKVLAMQQDLIQQIVERRKQISSLDSRAAEADQDINYYLKDRRNFSFNPSPSDRVTNGKYNGSTVSKSSVQSTASKMSETRHNGIAGKSPMKTGESGDSLRSDRLSPNRLGLAKDTDLDTTNLVEPTFLVKESERCVKDENAENQMEAKLDSVDPEADTDPEKEAMDDPPLAGANVVVPRYGNYAEPKDTGVLRCYKVYGQVPWHVPCGGVCYGDGNLAFVANDWHTALVPVYLKAYYRDKGLMKYARSVLVIHNIAHQVGSSRASFFVKSIKGRGAVEDFFHTDLPKNYIDLFKLYDPIGGDHFNIFAAGIKTADRVVTVSHGYARELKTSQGGWGLHRIINDGDWKLRGIVNGIDTKEWNPELDAHLMSSDGYTNYSSGTVKTGKPQCKAALQKELGLTVRRNVPMIGFIGRLDHQKGVDLIAEAMPWIVAQDVQLVMLGTGRPDLEEVLRRSERENHDKVRGWVGFSVKMAHRITAGADILLMPSRFEPCGLNQLYAMKYGTVPVVHAVGGLRDTVAPFDPVTETGYGWAFERAESGMLVRALGDCLNTYWNHKRSWEGLQTRGMTQDLSWDAAAKHYEEVLVAAKYQW
ncbi:hypothetical protein B296_00019106 [Ensete ventricosum]|uniref:Starch synthase catalytic domain-containing protein n=1 Tax=Ensete ventricosum TaxID=4639 RepID=A0A426ZPK5_ENSVE|nr:hypothetical protein B296_00019106 [Ensete ventricosum]